MKKKFIKSISAVLTAITCFSCFSGVSAMKRGRTTGQPADTPARKRTTVSDFDAACKTWCEQYVTTNEICEKLALFYTLRRGVFEMVDFDDITDEDKRNIMEEAINLMIQICKYYDHEITVHMFGKGALRKAKGLLGKCQVIQLNNGDDDPLGEFSWDLQEWLKKITDQLDNNKKYLSENRELFDVLSPKFNLSLTHLRSTEEHSDLDETYRKLRDSIDRTLVHSYRYDLTPEQHQQMCDEIERTTRDDVVLNLIRIQIAKREEEVAQEGRTTRDDVVLNFLKIQIAKREEEIDQEVMKNWPPQE